MDKKRKKETIDNFIKKVLACTLSVALLSCVAFTAPTAYADDITSDIRSAESAIATAEKAVTDAEAKYEQEKADAEAGIKVTDSDLKGAGREFIEELVKEAYANDSNDSSITEMAALSQLTIKGRMSKARKNESLKPIIDKLDASSNPDYTFEGLVNRSLSLSNLNVAIGYMEKCNAYRKEYNSEKHTDSSGNVIKLKNYRVSPYLMAASAVSNAIVYQTKTHSYVNSGEFINVTGKKCYENMAWGMMEPFKTWYDAEKAGTFTTTAHYKQIISTNYVVTGANFIDLVTMSEQSFCSSDAGTSYSVSGFKKLLNTFIEEKKLQIKEEKKAAMPIFTTEPDYLVSARAGLDSAVSTLKSTLKSYKPDTKAENYSYCKLKINYSIPEGYDGIKIYRSLTGKDGSYKLIFEKTAGKYTVDKDLETGTRYYYKACLYRTVNGKVIKSKYSDRTSYRPRPLKVKGLKLTKTKKGNLSVKWGKVNGADGYNVYVRKAGETKFKLLKADKNVKGLTLKAREEGSLKAIAVPSEPDTTYVIKVKAYRIVNGKKIYGDYSVLRKIKL